MPVHPPHLNPWQSQASCAVRLGYTRLDVTFLSVPGDSQGLLVRIARRDDEGWTH